MRATAKWLVGLHLIVTPVLTMAETAGQGASPEPSGRILFSRQLERQDDLFVLHLPAGTIERVTDHSAKDSHGVPSPDGRRIVFNSERMGWWKVWLMNADGSGVRQLTHPSSQADYHPSWSSDGSRIVYVSGSQGDGDIISMTADGGDVVNLTNHPAKDNFPVWSPTVNEIAFASDREGSWAIFLMQSDGTDVRRVTHTGDALEPGWFPDGRRLAYQAVGSGDEDTFDLWTILPGKDDPAQITQSKWNDKRPAVSPDGRWIVFESDRAGGNQIFIVTANGGDVRQLTTEGHCYAPAWFPDVHQ